MTGQRPKPTHLKVVTGNPGKRKLNDKEPRSAREVPSPPEHLTDWSKTAWGRMTVLLDGMGVLTVADNSHLSVFAVFMPTTDGNGFIKKASPIVKLFGDGIIKF